jgi:Haem-NO-binding/Heme NO binding associated/Adenylate and Guanylate cyclase catalytic domain
MLGWINDCLEKLVIEKFGVDAWHIVKQKAGSDVPDNGFLKLEHYSDKSTVDLVVAAGEVSGLPVPTLFELFGAFFVHYIRGEGYEKLLCCQGATLKDWCANINAIHQHLQSTFPKKMIMPNFWVTTGDGGNLILHYHSKRGNMFAPLAKGLVMEIAKFQFDVEIAMTMTILQGDEGSKVTSWVVSAVDPAQQWKLTQNQGMRNGIVNCPTELKCPFTGMTYRKEQDDQELKTVNVIKRRSAATSCGSLTSLERQEARCPYAADGGAVDPVPVAPSGDEDEYALSYDEVAEVAVTTTVNNVGLSASVTRALFPYSMVIDEDFYIIQVGQNMAKVLKKAEGEILGNKVMNFLEITKPLDVAWDWEWLRKLQDQSFQVDTAVWGSDFKMLFKASIVLVSDSPTQAMLIMSPDASDLLCLMKMGLTLSDLPVHGDYRDAVFLREHLSSQMNNALNMEKLSKSLAREKSLLESLLPHHAAEGLRAGKQVEPRLHQNVTVFFSDVVGFTNICKQIYPWEVIGMLNRL